MAPSRKNVLGSELQGLRALRLTAAGLPGDSNYYSRCFVLLILQKQIATIRSNVRNGLGPSSSMGVSVALTQASAYSMPRSCALYLGARDFGGCNASTWTQAKQDRCDAVRFDPATLKQFRASLSERPCTACLALSGPITSCTQDDRKVLIQLSQAVGMLL